MQQEADQSFAGPGGLSGRTRVGPYDSALRAVRKLVPAMGRGRPLPLVPNGRFPCAGQDRSGKRDVVAGSAAPGAEKAHSAGKRLFRQNPHRVAGHRGCFRALCHFKFEKV